MQGGGDASPVPAVHAALGTERERQGSREAANTHLKPTGFSAVLEAFPLRVGQLPLGLLMCAMFSKCVACAVSPARARRPLLHIE